ncbi:Fe2+-dependent dioxygenase [Prochlorococcus sp. MIT 1303]|uniref:Fe2+-dependent dioxygenase n=1 Tax=Prochlorococcus sp. MIT 1303 TaxID=1723647 RepID=UPI0007B36E23|nr:Fe2+-dependent dioxygenase [Prochlorococcus sp. MIT 1303]KZR61783.1 PKHD-type hydroxylase [Prochlorococcus sp. MIT 1303]
MLYLILNLIDEETVKKLTRQVMQNTNWKDGRYSSTYRTSGWKKNIQLPGKLEQDGESIVKTALINNKRIMRYTRIKKTHSIMFTRTGEGMFYRTHLDTPIVGDGRRDLSFTLFLNDSSSYEGGELVLKIDPETKIIKLNAGQVIIYPTQYLHEVREVTKGERLVSVGWIESEIPEQENRYILSLLDEARANMQKENDLGKDNKDIMNKLIVAYNMLYKRFSG